MKLSLRLLMSISHEELVFVFSMMRKYGGMSDPVIRASNKHNKNKHSNHNTIKKQKCPFDKDKCNAKLPCLYDFTCPVWDKCQDDHFLAYREIIKSCEKKDN